MKAKTINEVICKKFDEFTDSIKDDKVKELVIANTIITGGCIASMLLKEDINDYDLYFTNKETVLAVANYYTSIFNKEHDTKVEVLDGAKLEKDDPDYGYLDSSRVKLWIQSSGVAEAQDANYDVEKEDVIQVDTTTETAKNPFRPIFLSANAVTLSDKIQIVIRFYGEASEVHDNYDFVHCTNYWTSKDRKVVLNQAALESLLSKELRYIGSKYPLASIIRTRKFIKRDFTVNAGQYLKMCFQLSKLDLSNVKVLEDQLIGVDTAYFNMLIEGLKEKVKKEPNFKVEYSYISTIIDKIF